MANPPITTSGINDIFLYNEVHLDSSQRDTGTNNTPVFNLHPEVPNILGVKLLTAEIPFVWYALPGDAYFMVNGNKKTMPAGNYTKFTITTTLATVTGGGTWTYDDRTNKLVSNANTLSIPVANDNPYARHLGVMLGFDVGKTYGPSGGTMWSPNSVNLTGNNFLFVTSATLGSRIASAIRTNGSLTPNPNIIGKIPITVNPGSVLCFTDPTALYAFDAGLDLIQQIDVGLLDPITHQAVDMQGVPWSVTLQFLVQRDTSATRLLAPADYNASFGSQKRIRVQ